MTFKAPDDSMHRPLSPITAHGRTNTQENDMEIRGFVHERLPGANGSRPTLYLPTQIHAKLKQEHEHGGSSDDKVKPEDTTSPPSDTSNSEHTDAFDPLNLLFEIDDLIGEDTAACDDGKPTVALPLLQPVFPAEQLAQFEQVIASRPKDEREACIDYLSSMLRNDGQREFSPLPTQLPELRDCFPNFSEALDCIESQVMLASRRGEKVFAMDAILLVGEPGIGKTLFVEAFAQAIGIPWELFSIASCQGSFDFCGTASHWGNSKPGRIWKLLAKGQHCNPVILLDELEKAPAGLRDPVLPSLLDLMEPRTAVRYHDQSTEVTFDASFVIKIATANSLDNLPDPLISRLNVIHVAPPTDMDLHRLYQDMWDDLATGVEDCPRLSSSLLREMAYARMPPREARRRLRLTLGLALRDRNSEVSSLCGNDNTKRPGIGFLR